MKEAVVLIVIMLLIVGFVVGAALAINSSEKDREQSRKASYSECISKTNDIKWCVEKFYQVKLP